MDALRWRLRTTHTRLSAVRSTPGGRVLLKYVAKQRGGRLGKDLAARPPRRPWSSKTANEFVASSMFRSGADAASLCARWFAGARSARKTSASEAPPRPARKYAAAPAPSPASRSWFAALKSAVARFAPPPDLRRDGRVGPPSPKKTPRDTTTTQSATRGRADLKRRATASLDDDDDDARTAPTRTTRRAPRATPRARRRRLGAPRPLCPRTRG